jgi:hypothetical protein
MSFIILTNKDTYRTDLNSPGIETVESYDYVFFDKVKATYSIAKVTDKNCKITITENSDKSYVNHIAVKFFEAFDDIEEARKELAQMVGPNSENQRLKKVS